MSEKGSMDFSFIKKLTPQQKRLRNIIPLGIFAIVGVIYFSIQSSDTKKETVKAVVADTTIPSSGTKELSDSKLTVLNDYEDFNQDRKEQIMSDFDSNLSDPLGNDEPQEVIVKEVIKEDPNKVKYNDIQSALAKMELEKNRRLAQNRRKPKPVSTTQTRTTNTRSNAPTKRTVEKNYDLDDWGENDDFFDETLVNSAQIEKIKSKPKKKSEGVTDKIIEAVIHNDQVITNNGRVTMRLKKSAKIKGKLYKANTLFYGKARFALNRVLLEITNISSNNVALKAYDKQDGNAGIFIENENLMGEALNESSDSAIDEVDVGGVRIGSVVKNVFKKRQQIPKITLLNNYELVLKL